MFENVAIFVGFPGAEYILGRLDMCVTGCDKCAAIRLTITKKLENRYRFDIIPFATQDDIMDLHTLSVSAT